MNYIEKQLAQSLYEPKQMLVVYKSNHQQDQNYYIEQHGIIKNPKGYVALAGQSMRIKDVQKIFSVLAEKETTAVLFNGIIPENVLYFNANNFKTNIIWYEKAQKRVLFFNKNFYHEESVTCNMPAILYHYNNGNLYIYALKSNARPNDKTKLYRFPVPNIYADCKVCFGNVKISDNFNSAEELMKKHQEAFWKSEFTSFLNENTLKLNFFDEIDKAKSVCFNNSLLIDTNDRLKDIYESYD